MAALAAIEADEHTAMLITRITFPEGMPHGVSLALMARVKKRGIQVLFLARREMADQAQGVGEVLQTPVLAEDIVAKGPDDAAPIGLSGSDAAELLRQASRAGPCWQSISKDAVPVPAESPETLRKQAEHARWLADLVPVDPAAERLRAYADELDAEAAAAGGKGGPHA